mmetsp:Transcript_22010/g.67560  ORF Transcript_22010/g.67560 Transcript_22010/m.67560 type:complete len:128 (+) Transcript_22010:2-385(+)
MNVMNEIQNINPDQEDFKSHALPLARIKKIMKSEEEILNDAPNAPNSRFMISAEAPIMFAKACEIFIAELTTRSWGHTEENKRRTLQRNDISVAVDPNPNPKSRNPEPETLTRNPEVVTLTLTLTPT